MDDDLTFAVEGFGDLIERDLAEYVRRAARRRRRRDVLRWYIPLPVQSVLGGL